jgi:hypothetical protein
LTRFGFRAADIDPRDALRVRRLSGFNRADEPQVSVIRVLYKVVDGVRMLGVVVEPPKFVLSGSVEEDYLHLAHVSEDRPVAWASVLSPEADPTGSLTIDRPAIERHDGHAGPLDLSRFVGPYRLAAR